MFDYRFCHPASNCLNLETIPGNPRSKLYGQLKSDVHAVTKYSPYYLIFGRLRPSQ